MECENKNFHVIGVLVNMTRGEIGFTINGQFHGIAFYAEELKEGPLYPAIALREGGQARFCKVLGNPEDFLLK